MTIESGIENDKTHSQTQESPLKSPPIENCTIFILTKVHSRFRWGLLTGTCFNFHPLFTSIPEEEEDPENDDQENDDPNSDHIRDKDMMDQHHLQTDLYSSNYRYHIRVRWGSPGAEFYFSQRHYSRNEGWFEELEDEDYEDEGYVTDEDEYADLPELISM
eukprot:Nk52_evm1s335 gene=Nk52_evmTU1s335